MSGHLLDTNVLSELCRKQPEPQVVARLASVARDALFTSAVCAMELRYGAARHPHGAALWARIDRQILSQVNVLPLNRAAAEKAGELLADLERRGQPIGVEDVLIAATALAHKLTLVTRNVKHFERIHGVRIENWWP